MGKAKLKKKIEGYRKQLANHIDKFKEAEERGAPESMTYMAKEMSNYLKRMDMLKSKLLPKKSKKKK